MKIVYKKDVKPYKAHRNDAGWDLRAAETVYIPPQQWGMVLTGVRTEIEPGYMGLIAPRSGMNKRGLFVQIGIIDSGYRGEIGVVVYNARNEVVKVEKGDRIAQLIFVKISNNVTFFEESKVDLKQFEISGDRKTKGFGSTGVK